MGEKPYAIRMAGICLRNMHLKRQEAIDAGVEYIPESDPRQRKVLLVSEGTGRKQHRYGFPGGKSQLSEIVEAKELFKDLEQGNSSLDDRDIARRATRMNVFGIHGVPLEESFRRNELFYDECEKAHGSLQTLLDQLIDENHGVNNLCDQLQMYETGQATVRSDRDILTYFDQVGKGMKELAALEFEDELGLIVKTSQKSQEKIRRKPYIHQLKLLAIYFERLYPTDNGTQFLFMPMFRLCISGSNREINEVITRRVSAPSSELARYTWATYGTIKGGHVDGANPDVHKSVQLMGNWLYENDYFGKTETGETSRNLAIPRNGI